MVNISALSGIPGSQQNIQRTNDRLQNVIATLVTGSRLNQASADVAALSIAAQLQSQTTGLRQVSNSLAQTSSLTQVADQGASQIEDALNRLTLLAQQARNGALNAQNRDALNREFQQVRAQIDQLSDSTAFGGRKLLNGDLSGNNALSLDAALGVEEGGDNATLAIEDLDTGSLFGGQDLSLVSADAAAQAVDVLTTALGQVASVRASVGAFQEAVDFAAANIDSVLANQEAALSILEDADFAESSSLFALLNLQHNVGLATAAQGNRLSDNVLKLLG